MKEINELALPDDLKYAEDHEWIRVEGDKVKIGISDFAQDQLGDITFVEMPEAGDTFDQGDECGTLESTKAVSELYMPIGGEITAVNGELEDNPALLNSSPYDEGWIMEVKPSSTSELDGLMDKAAYLDMLSKEGD